MPAEIPSVLEILHVIAPGGILDAEDCGFADSVAYLRVNGYSEAIAEAIGHQVRKFCSDRAVWTIVDGRRCRILPGLGPPTGQ
jgi:hypothetical protein